MNVYISKERIWWTPDTEDKPSLSYFNTFDSTLTLADVRVNFKDFNNVNIVANTDDITYVKVEHNNKIYYYYTNGIDSILSNGYQYRLILDKFTTYTLPLLNNLIENEVPLKVTRSLIDDIERIYLVDELLDGVPKSYNKTVYKKREFNVDSDGYYYLSQNNQKLKIEKTSLLMNPVVYAVFSDFVGYNGIKQPYVFIPVLTSQKGVQINVKVNNSTQNITTKVYNTNNVISFWAYNLYANNFVGFYILPNLLYFGDAVRVQSYSTGVSGELDRISLLIIDTDFQFTNLFNVLIEDMWLPTIPVTRGVLPNGIYLSDIQMIPYLNIKYYGNELKAEFWGNFGANDFSFNINNALYTYGGVGQIVYNVDKLPLSDTLINFPYQLPSLTNTYQKYVESTYNSVNTGYQVSRENALLSAGNTLFGVSKRDNWKTLNPFNLVSGFIRNNQQARTIRASYRDARNRLQPTLNTSNIEDNKFVRVACENGCYEVIEYKELSTETLSLMNNVLYYYGYFLPQMNNLKYITSKMRGSDFTYFALEEDYISQMIPVYSLVNTPKQLYSDIASDLSGGVRLWNKVPNYKT